MELRPHIQGRARWVAPAAILLVFVWLVWLRSPAERFGVYHDDALYAAAARSIADGEGYLQASLPGSPPGTKYPAGFPYFLALGMRIVPDARAAPERLWMLSVAAACWALLVAFSYFSGWRGVGWPLAAGATALAAAQDTFALLAGSLLSDALFMALALTALYLADRESPSRFDLGFAAVLTGLALLTRSAGVAIATAIVVHGLLGGRYRAAAAFAAVVSPFAVVGALSKLGSQTAPPASAPGFRQTWLYYTDYAGFWQASVPDSETLVAMLYKNFGSLLEAPALLSIGASPGGQIGTILWATVSVAILSGLLRQARQDRLRAIHLAAGFSGLMALLWNYEIADRLLLPFAMLFALGFLIEARHMVGNFWRVAQAGHPMAERAISAVCLGLVVCLAVFMGTRTVRMQRAAAAAQIADFDGKYRELFAWLREHSAPDDRLVAIDEGLFYLHTGRQGMWPLALTTESRFLPDATRLEAQLAMLPDTAREIGARYAIQTDHDYAFAPMARERWLEWTAGLPVLVENTAGSARILDLEGHRTRPERLSSELAGPESR